MFGRLDLHGGKADILWGYRTESPAVVLKHWRVLRIAKDPQHRRPIARLSMNQAQVVVQAPKQWTLSGVPERIEHFMLRQKPLLLAVPRPKGFFLWPIETIDFVGPNHIRATLGPPEQ